MAVAIMVEVAVAVLVARVVVYVDASRGAKERRGGETDQKIFNPSFKNFARARMKLGASFHFRLDP